MSDELKYWLVFVEGFTDEGDKIQFPMTYIGKKVIWEYLLETVQEDYELTEVKFNGYEEISKRKYDHLHIAEC